jgi:hypothetical protein
MGVCLQTRVWWFLQLVGAGEVPLQGKNKKGVVFDVGITLHQIDIGGTFGVSGYVYR